MEDQEHVDIGEWLRQLELQDQEEFYGDEGDYCE